MQHITPASKIWDYLDIQKWRAYRFPVCNKSRCGHERWRTVRIFPVTLAKSTETAVNIRKACGKRCLKREPPDCQITACQHTGWHHGLLTRHINCGLRMRPECRESFPHHRLQRKPLVSDPGMQHGTCITHVPWCMLGSLTRGDRENAPGIPGACATCNFTYLSRCPWPSVTRSQIGE